MKNLKKLRRKSYELYIQHSNCDTNECDIRQIVVEFNKFSFSFGKCVISILYTFGSFELFENNHKHERTEIAL